MRARAIAVFPYGAEARFFILTLFNLQYKHLRAISSLWTPDSAFADISVITVGHSEDKVVGVSRSGRCFNLSGGNVSAAVGDVIGDRPVAEKDILYINIINQNRPEEYAC